MLIFSSPKSASYLHFVQNAVTFCMLQEKNGTFKPKMEKNYV